MPVLLFSVIAHEYAHGYAALKQGDTTALMLGRLTWNPVKHIDPFMTLILPAMLFFFSGGRMMLGGAKPERFLQLVVKLTNGEGGHERSKSL